MGLEQFLDLSCHHMPWPPTGGGVWEDLHDIKCIRSHGGRRRLPGDDVADIIVDELRGVHAEFLIQLPRLPYIVKFGVISPALQ